MEIVGTAPRAVRSGALGKRALFFQAIIVFFDSRRFQRSDLSVDFLGSLFVAVNREKSIYSNTEKFFIFFQIRLDQIPVRIGNFNKFSAVELLINQFFARITDINRAAGSKRKYIRTRDRVIHIHGSTRLHHQSRCRSE